MNGRLWWLVKIGGVVTLALIWLLLFESAAIA
jgi:hypothetical protein